MAACEEAARRGDVVDYLPIPILGEAILLGLVGAIGAAFLFAAYRDMFGPDR